MLTQITIEHFKRAASQVAPLYSRSIHNTNCTYTRLYESSLLINHFTDALETQYIFVRSQINHTQLCTLATHWYPLHTKTVPGCTSDNILAGRSQLAENDHDVYKLLSNIIKIIGF